MQKVRPRSPTLLRPSPNQHITFRKTTEDPSGWGLPKWNIKCSKKVIATRGISITTLSRTASGCTILPGEESTSLARAVNQHAASIRDSYPSQFCKIVPVAIAEAAYARDNLHADGITLYTRYNPSTTSATARSLHYRKNSTAAQPSSSFTQLIPLTPASSTPNSPNPSSTLLTRRAKPLLISL